jgi:flavin-dependent dehydrogenase
LSERLRAESHRVIESVEFIGIKGHAVTLTLPAKADPEVVVKRSLFDQLLLVRARELGAEVYEGHTISALKGDGAWQIIAGAESFSARILVAADGRNSTVARLLKIFPRAARERVALQAHVPLPRDFGPKIVLQFLREGYSGQAPVNDSELNVCLVGRPPTIASLRAWAGRRFNLPNNQAWRTITPLTRATMPVARDNLFFIGDVARVVEPFTGEGIFYALRSGELAAQAIMRGRPHDYAVAHAAMYRGRLWINRLARAAVLSPRVASAVLRVARYQPAVLRLLTAKITLG